jgi:pilus assembly protein CpaC
MGHLFRSTAYKRGETELVIVVTPYLVKPVNDGDIKLPTDGMESINDIDRLIGNKVTDGKTGAKRPGPPPRLRHRSPCRRCPQGQRRRGWRGLQG